MATMQSLHDILGEEIRLYERYLELSHRDKPLMMALKLDELEASNKEKATIILKLQIADKSRKQITRQVAQAKGLGENRVTIKEICLQMDPEEARPVLTLKERLNKVITQVKEVNDVNTLFAHNSLRWMNTSLTYLKDFITPSIYSERGKVVEGIMNGRVIERSV